MSETLDVFIFYLYEVIGPGREDLTLEWPVVVSVLCVMVSVGDPSIHYSIWQHNVKPPTGHNIDF